MSIAKTFTVTVVSTGSGNKYFIDGVQQDTVMIGAGLTYKFDQPDSSNGNHPLRFSTTSDGTHSGGTQYTTGVTAVGVPGNSGAYTQIEVAADAPSTLYYYCTNHSGMGGTANVVDPVTMYDHETGFNYDSGSVFCETGPVSIGAGDQIAKVTEVIPDELTQGDVDLKFKTRFHPNDTEREFGPFNPSNPTSVRFSGRQVRMRVEGDQLAAWRVGTMRLETKAGGGR